MKQIWVTRTGSPDVLEIEEAPDPTPKTGQVRIRPEAIGLNYADVLARRGKAGFAEVPFVPGYEVSGVIDMVAQGVSDFREGEAVMALTRGGAYADLVCVPQAQVFKRFDWMSAEDGAALPVDYLTAFASLIVMGGVRAGDTVLLHDTSSGVGLAGLDLCRIAEAKTIGTAPIETHDFLQGRGIDLVIDPYEADYEEMVQEFTERRGLQVIVNPYGGIHWQKNLRLLAPSGRLVNYSNGRSVSGNSPPWLQRTMARLGMGDYAPSSLLRETKGVAGFNLHAFWQRFDILQAWMEQIVDWYDQALFRPHVDNAFAFAEVSKAHTILEREKYVGKVLLVP